MDSGHWTSAQRDLVITTLEAFRGHAQDKATVVDQVLRFIVTDTKFEITPEIGLILSTWIDRELDALAGAGGRIKDLTEKIFRVALAARAGDDGFFELIGKAT